LDKDDGGKPEVGKKAWTVLGSPRRSKMRRGRARRRRWGGWWGLMTMRRGLDNGGGLGAMAVLAPRVAIEAALLLLLLLLLPVFVNYDEC